jgi:hypothetical protein
MAAACSESGNHSIFVSPGGRTSSVPRYTEINDDLAKKIYKDLGTPHRSAMAPAMS